MLPLNVNTRYTSYARNNNVKRFKAKVRLEPLTMGSVSKSLAAELSSR